MSIGFIWKYNLNILSNYHIFANYTKLDWNILKKSFWVLCHKIWPDVKGNCIKSIKDYFSYFFLYISKESLVFSSLSYSLRDSSRKTTIYFSRNLILSLAENIFSCSSDLFFISLNYFLILLIWLRYANKNSDSCFSITCSTFLFISSIILFSLL